ncbi:MAG: hypothetical protein IJE78_09710 [Bacteroidaceae bacterium]|nr:hypothetical protein [Bacteroidaceae bacterium]
MEKKNWNFGLMLLVCSFLLCVNVEAKKSLITSTKYDIEGVEIGEQGTYLVKVFIYTKKSSATVEEFKYAAVHGVIFRGFSGKGFSGQKAMARPESQSQNADFYNSFFNNGDYLSYAQIVNPASERVKIGKEYKIAAIVSVSKDALRKALEEAGVIRSLNSGF